MIGRNNGWRIIIQESNSMELLKHVEYAIYIGTAKCPTVRSSEKFLSKKDCINAVTKLMNDLIDMGLYVSVKTVV